MSVPQRSQADLLEDIAWVMSCFIQDYGGEAKTEIGSILNRLRDGQPSYALAERWSAVLNQCLRWHGEDRHYDHSRTYLGRALYELYQSVLQQSEQPLRLLRPAADGRLAYVPDTGP
ncbi:hypothetical protein [Arenimonas oryziterrae]|uniref:Uncharacterized protein n=1 Tax=Arenimonas oryziterrae DSM 21050 = YC6267 TaxID=1121015 RepID=A0A091AWV9_9GAMM|nr:hypothetical protein [Arenimonas oryziterrae]KFN43901.1 hypothetical protein N789_08105 [Arenimonas oryziterrae DSM 21050 = YC6267]